jgi:hypothetical protein
MRQNRFNGILQQITEKYPNVDIAGVLQDELRLPLDKAEVLAGRIEKQILQKDMPEQKNLKTLTEKNPNPETGTVYALESLSNKEFGDFIKWLLQELGYDLNFEKIENLAGFDYIASRGYEKTAFLARKYPKTAIITETIILTAQQAKNIYECQKTVVLATSGFSEQAKLEAEKLGIELWDYMVLDEKIGEVKKKMELEVQAGFPKYKGTLLDSLLRLSERKDFKIEQRAGEKFDVFFPGVKFPLLTFQVQNGVVARLVYRVKYNEPVGENDAEALIRTDKNGCRFGPEDPQAYAQVTEYLEQFLE